MLYGREIIQKGDLGAALCVLIGGGLLQDNEAEAEAASAGQFELNGSLIAVICFNVYEPRYTEQCEGFIHWQFATIRFITVVCFACNIFEALRRCMYITASIVFAYVRLTEG